MRFNDLGKFNQQRQLHDSLTCLGLLDTELKLAILKVPLLCMCFCVGDVRQLPSIQPGNILYDLFDSLKPVGWAIEMRTNHRAESQLIVENAGL